MSKPLVTVFIPVYNVEEYIKEALESILYQSYENLDILIVNDASTDNSLEIIQSFDDKRIRIINNEENKGIPYNRNLGLIEAIGDYIAIMDSDDIAHPRRIEKQVNYLEAHSDIDLVGTDYEVFGGAMNGGILKRKVRNKYITPEQLKIKFLYNCAIHNPTSMLRRSTIEKYNLRYNEDYFVVQDYDFFVQLSKIGRLAILPEVLYKYRVGHSNITKKSLESKVKQRKKIISSIHTDILYYYGFSLSNEELETYNILFFDNPSKDILAEDFFIKLNYLVRTLVNLNHKKNIFEPRMFNNIFLDSARVALSNLNINLSKKLMVYKQLCKELELKQDNSHLIYLIGKSAYYSIVR